MLFNVILVACHAQTHTQIYNKKWTVDEKDEENDRRKCVLTIDANGVRECYIFI